MLLTDDIYNTIIDSGPEHGVEFFHGYTYSAHPACVAASHATLDIYENEGIFEKAIGKKDKKDRNNIKCHNPKWNI